MAGGGGYPNPDGGVYSSLGVTSDWGSPGKEPLARDQRPVTWGTPILGEQTGKLKILPCLRTSYEGVTRVTTVATQAMQ